MSAPDCIIAVNQGCGCITAVACPVGRAVDDAVDLRATASEWQAEGRIVRAARLDDIRDDLGKCPHKVTQSRDDIDAIVIDLIENGDILTPAIEGASGV